MVEGADEDGFIRRRCGWALAQDQKARVVALVGLDIGGEDFHLVQFGGRAGGDGRLFLFIGLADDLYGAGGVVFLNDIIGVEVFQFEQEGAALG